MTRVIDSVCRVIEWAIAALLLAMVVLVFGNVVLRYAFNSGIIVSEELSRWAFVWLIFLGAVVALREDGHLGTDFVVSRLGRTGKRICLGLGQLLMLGATGLLFSGSLAQARLNWDVEAAVTGWSSGLLYLAAIVFAVPAALLLLFGLWRTVSGSLPHVCRR